MLLLLKKMKSFKEDLDQWKCPVVNIFNQKWFNLWFYRIAERQPSVDGW